MCLFSENIWEIDRKIFSDNQHANKIITLNTTRLTDGHSWRNMTHYPDNKIIKEYYRCTTNSYLTGTHQHKVNQPLNLFCYTHSIIHNCKLLKIMIFFQQYCVDFY